MPRIANIYACFSLAVGAAVLSVPATAQERGEEVVGSITSVDGQALTVSREKAPEVRVQLAPGTQVEFRDSGDRKLFPNPGVADLRAGMGVRFVYGTGTIDRIVVHYVPSGHVAGHPAPPPIAASAPQELKARILSIASNGRDLSADVAGRTERFRVEGNDARRVSRGELVVLTVENRNGERVVTRIDPAELFGTITRLDSRGRSVSIDANGREETYRVENRDLLENLQVGANVRFDVEERGGSRVIVAMNRDKSRR